MSINIIINRIIFLLMTNYCKNCGAELPSEAEFCPECGVEVGAVQQKEVSEGSQESEKDGRNDGRVFSRRSVIALVLAGVGAGGGALLLNGGILGIGSGRSLGRLNVPNGVDFVAYYDSAVLEDPTTEEIVNANIDTLADTSPMYSGPESYDEALREFAQPPGTNLDLRDIEEGVVFGNLRADGGRSTQERFGAVISSDWNKRQVLDYVESETTVREGMYKNTTVYTAEGYEQAFLAVLGEGVYAFSDTEEMIQDIIDVEAGDAGALSGPLRNEFESVNDGYIAFAADISNLDLGIDQEMEFLNDINTLSGSYSTGGNEVGMTVNFRTDSAGESETVQTRMESTVSDLEREIANSPRSLPVQPNRMLDSLRIETEGEYVRASYRSTVSEAAESGGPLLVLAAVIGTFVLGLGENVQSTPSAGVSTNQEAGESIAFTVVDTGNLDYIQLIGPDGRRSISGSTDDIIAAGATIEIKRGGFSQEEIEGNLVTPNDDECRIRHAANDVDGQRINGADIPCDGSGIRSMSGNDISYETGSDYQLIGIVDGSESVIQSVTSMTR
jgi:hypothetical protein